jgi:hypothetical protein
MQFISYELVSGMLCLGERNKKGTFRPTVTTIPYSQITGALRAKFGREEDIQAVGILVIPVKKEYLIYSPRNKISNVSKIPLTIEYLQNAKGVIYLPKNERTEMLPPEVIISMGAFKHRGFGESKLSNKKIIETCEIKRGVLSTRIPEEKLGVFDVRKIIKPVYGYLFKPTSETSGVYVRSLFEGSEIAGPAFLLST